MSTEDNSGNEDGGGSEKSPWQDRDTLHRLHVTDGLKPKEIANRLECNTRTIIRWLSKLNVGEYECPTCGESFGTDRGMKAHHGRVHGESIAEGVEIECEWCGDTYEEYPSRVDRSRFCSVSCKDKGNGERVRGKRTGPTLTCPWCGGEFYTYPSREDSRIFCGMQCLGEWMSENKSGENSHFWKGGWEGYYGPNWNRQRRLARERDGHVCQDPGCEITSEEHLRVWGKALHVHHIVRFHDFDNYKEANRLSNLVTLCQPHHLGKWENLPGLRPDTGNRD